MLRYNKVDTSKVTKTVVAGGFAAVDSCMSTVGIVPDLLLAPKYGFWDGRYICTQAKHTINENGFTTTVTGRRILEGY